MTEIIELITEFILKVAQKNREMELKKRFLILKTGNFYENLYEEIKKFKKCDKESNQFFFLK